MSDQIKLFIKNIPNNIPDDKFLEILKKNFENLISNAMIYKHQHKFNPKNSKICYFTLNCLEAKSQIYEFFSTFDMIDHRGLKHKVKIVDSIYMKPNMKMQDPVNNTISNINYYNKFVECSNNGKLVEFKLEEDKFNEGIFDGIIEEKREENEKKTKIVAKSNHNESHSHSDFVNKKIIINKNQERVNEFNQNVESNTYKEVEIIGIEYSNNYVNNNNNYGKNGKSYKNNYHNNEYNTKFNNKNYNNNYNNNYDNSNNYYNNNERDYTDGYYDNNNGYSNKKYKNYKNK